MYEVKKKLSQSHGRWNSRGKHFHALELKESRMRYLSSILTGVFDFIETLFILSVIHLKLINRSTRQHVLVEEELHV